MKSASSVYKPITRKTDKNNQTIFSQQHDELTEKKAPTKYHQPNTT
jgi:hypothetical protein